MKTLRLIGMAIIAVIMSINFVACDDDDEDSNTIDTSSLVGTWGLVRCAGWEVCSEKTEKEVWEWTNDPFNPDVDSEKIHIEKIAESGYSISSYYYTGSDWKYVGAQRGTLNGNTVELQDYEVNFEGNLTIETLTADKLVIRIKYDEMENYPPNHRDYGEYVNTYTRIN